MAQVTRSVLRPVDSNPLVVRGSRRAGRLSGIAGDVNIDDASVRGETELDGRVPGQAGLDGGLSRALDMARERRTRLCRQLGVPGGVRGQPVASGVHSRSDTINHSLFVLR